MGISDFIKRYPVLIYYVFTFVISWGGVLLVIGGPGGITSADEQFQMLLPAVILALLAGPSISGILLTGLVSGREGLRAFWLRLTKWKVAIRWYVAALLLAPLLITSIYLALSLFSPQFLPTIVTVNDKISHLIMALITGLMAGVFEELGWTGFAIPRLRKRYSVLTTGLVAGLLWAIWHILPVFWVGYGSGAITGTLSLVSYLLDPFLFLMVFRVLMVWVYDHTKSLFVAILMHISLTASARIFTPAGMTGVQLLVFDLIWAAILWGAVAAVVLISRRVFPRLSFSPARV